MSREEVKREATGGASAPSQALAAADPAAALRNAVNLWAEQNTRPETLARAEKLRDKVSAVTSFFNSAGRHPGEVTPDDVSRWRGEMERGAQAGHGLRQGLPPLGLLPLADGGPPTLPPHPE